MHESTSCPNHCGPLLTLEKPATVFIDPDAFTSLSDDFKKEVTFLTTIHKICPKCGFYESTEHTFEQWERMEASKTIPLKNNSGKDLAQTQQSPLANTCLSL